MSAANLNGIMDALGVRLQTISALAGKTYDFPVENAVPPAAIVGYPTEIEDFTKGRGFDRLVFPVWVIVGGVHARSSRDALGAYLGGSGATSVKTALEGDPSLAGVASNVRVIGTSTGVITLGGADYAGATFTVEVIS